MENTQRTINLESDIPSFTQLDPSGAKALNIKGFDPQLQAKADALAAKLDSAVVRHADFEDLLRVAVKLMKRCGTTRHPGGGHVIGDSRCGKSTVCERLEMAYPAHTVEGKLVVPILSVECDQNVTAASLLKSMLDELKSPFTSGKNAAELHALLIDALKSRETSLILIDEANHISEGGKKKSAHGLGDALKRLYDDSKVPMLLLGAPALANLFKVNDQLRQRLAGEYTLRRFPYGEGLSDVLKALRARMPMPCDVVLDDPEPSYAMQLASEGRMGVITEILKEAVRSAVLRSSGSVEREDLMEAVRGRYGRGRNNPFAIDHTAALMASAKVSKKNS